MGRLDGKVALISGGARGQGATEAKLFAREGARVVFGDMLDDAGRQVEADIRAAGGEATYVHLDVTSDDDWREAVGTAVNRYGKLDILVNNAGIIRRFSIEETTREVWDEVMAVNSTGVFLGTKYAIPAMRQAGGGRLSTSPPFLASLRLALRPTMPRKVPCASLPKSPPSSTPKIRSGVIPSIPVPSIPPCCKAATKTRRRPCSGV